jgi:hypothetical protein
VVADQRELDYEGLLASDPIGVPEIEDVVTHERKGNSAINVWCGNYWFGRGDDSFFGSAVLAARKYAGKHSKYDQSSKARFRDTLDDLRSISPVDGTVLLDQLEHRREHPWEHPECPAALYVLACKLHAPDGGALVSRNGRLVQQLLITKVGEAKRTVAGRIEAYLAQPLGGLSIVKGSQNLRAVIYGHGPATMREGEIQERAACLGSRVEVYTKGARRYMDSDETHVGAEIIDDLCAFARQREAERLP